jgi:hypothetical protein
MTMETKRAQRFDRAAGSATLDASTTSTTATTAVIRLIAAPTRL